MSFIEFYNSIINDNKGEIYLKYFNYFNTLYSILANCNYNNISIDSFDTNSVCFSIYINDINIVNYLKLFNIVYMYSRPYIIESNVDTYNKLNVIIYT